MVENEFKLMADHPNQRETSALRQIGSMFAMKRIDTHEVLFTIKLEETVEPGNIIAVPVKPKDN